MRLLTAVLFAALLGACASPGDVNHPIARKLTWFSFMNGNDIRRDCTAGGLDRYRLIYNARYTRQVRIYELSDDGRLFQRVTGWANLAEVIPGISYNGDWWGKATTVSLTDPQRVGLLASLDKSGFGEPPPKGVRLQSDAYYWTAVACRNGVVSFNAWQFGDGRFEKLSFPEALFALDLTEVKVPQAAKAPYVSQRKRDRGLYFSLEVGDNGLLGTDATIDQEPWFQ